METERVPSGVSQYAAAWYELGAQAPVALAITYGSSHLLHDLNLAMINLLGLPSAPAYDRPLVEVVPPVHAQAVGALFDRVFMTGVADVHEQPHPTGGTTVWLYTVWPIRQSDGRPAGLGLQIQERTAHTQAPDHEEAIAIELREANERLIIAGLREHAARGDAEAALTVRDQFLSIASHELKSPLTSLLGYTQLLQRHLRRDGGDERIQRMAEVIGQQANRLNALIDQLLDVSHLARGQFSIVQHPLDLGALVRRIVDDVSLILTKHTLILTGSDERIIVRGDDLRLEQVVHNVLSNAVKYSPAGGPIVVRVERQATEAMMEVTDQGLGIAPAAQTQLFQPFYRARHTDQHISGFGIGLYVVQEIVARHGGRIEVSSIEGQGSTFRVVLPMYLDDADGSA